MALLEVKDLHVSFRTDDGIVHAVRGVSFQVEPGQTLGIVGESGSGKSVSTQTIMGLTRGAEVEGQALFEGRDLLTMSRPEMASVRGAKIGMIFQDPLSSLHPFYKVGWQIVEMIRLHDKEISKASARKRAVELLTLVGIPQPDRRVDDYPHQFSGGMRQRAMIAMAMAHQPGAAHRRRAHHRAGRDGPGPGAADDQQAAAGVRHCCDPDHPRPRRYR